jgi:DNA-binding NarL/FixJ family response regulator
MTDKRIRILIVDDHPLLRRGLTATLGPESDMEVVGAAGSGVQALELFRELLPDVTVMDVTLTSDMSGIETTRAIRQEFPDARIIMLSVHKSPEDIYRALSAGAAAYLFKDTLGDDLVSTIREVYDGAKPMQPEIARKLTEHMFQAHLTARELEVLQLITEGCRNKEIAQRLKITENTAQGHVKNILAKLGVNDRAGAISVAIRRGILHVGD